ncbi:MAG: hypothetical protein D3910_09475 [Candidatus Electrothrix sp. ATG2]|nr:hypothetical protein [Candidatus Electrothrix sp. ATG2]
MINFEKLDKSYQETVIYLSSVLVGLAIFIAPWINIQVKYFSLQELPIYIKLFISFVGLLIIVSSIFDHYKRKEDSKKLELEVTKSINNRSSDIEYHFNCINDTKRDPIIKNFKPSLYLSLEKNFLNLANNPACDINIFPYLNFWGDTIEKPEFIKKFGYKFSGKNMLSVQMNEYFPYDKAARTFIFAVNATERPEIKRPMFFFSYGSRKKHKPGVGVTNHDRSFGMFWGEPAPNEPIKEDYKGIGIRIFFYCEHAEVDRDSDYCDTKVICDIEINQWEVFAVTYDGNKVSLYRNGSRIFNEQISLKTSKTINLNIGGFVHHNEDGAIVARDLDYSMNGFIREFIMFRKSISPEKIKSLTSKIHNLLP